MKISRYKKLNKILNYYCNNFNFRPPFQVLIDATFCYAALNNKVAIEEQLKKYLQQEIKFITTQCIILESENLGPKLTGATMIVKKFHVHKCGHEGNPIVGSSCILSLIKKSRYIVATQDRKLQDILRKQPGQPILYLHKATPILDPISESTKNIVNKKIKSIPLESIDQVKILKKKAGIPEVNQNENIKFKKRKPKNPNPLSCKKKKKKNEQTMTNNENRVTKENKRKRKRIKIPNHIKEVLKNT